MNYRKALLRLMEWCSQAERCSKDVSEKLNKFDLSKEQVESAIEYLKKEHFLEDERYAQSFVNDKLKFNKWGKIKLSFMLHQKHIDDTVIAEVLNKIDEKLYNMILRD